MSPEELEQFNLERGVTEEKVHPIYGRGMSYKQMEPLYENLGYMYKADGGIANLTRTVAPDSGPVSRGLRSLYIDDMD